MSVNQAELSLGVGHEFGGMSEGIKGQLAGKGNSVVTFHCVHVSDSQM